MGNSLTMSAEASVSYAALILADSEVEISASNLLAITKAAGSSVENVWAETFAKGLEGKDLKEICFLLLLLPQLLVLLLLPPLPPEMLQLPRKLLKKPLKNPMTTWDSDCSINGIDHNTRSRN